MTTQLETSLNQPSKTKFRKKDVVSYFSFDVINWLKFVFFHFIWDFISTHTSTFIVNWEVTLTIAEDSPVKFKQPSKKRRRTENLNLCVICQADSQEKLKNPGDQGIKTFIASIEETRTAG